MLNHDPNKIVLGLSCGGRNYLVYLNKNITYSGLAEYVKKKLSIEDDFCTSMCYKNGKKDYQVSGDDDLEVFKMKLAVPNGKVDTLVISTYKEETNKSFEMGTPRPRKSPQSEVTGSSKKPSKYVLSSPKLDYMPETPLDVNNAYKFAWQSNTFHHMPPTPDTTRINFVQKMSSIASRCVLFSGDKFLGKAECLQAIGAKALVEGFEFVTKKSNKTRFKAICIDKECTWKILSQKLCDSIWWSLTTVEDAHTCSMTRLHPNHRNATATVLGALLRDKVADYTRTYRPKDIQKDLKRDLNIDISYKKAWRGRKIAFEMAMGSPADSFAQLPYYCHNLKLANEGTVTHIETDAEGRFKLLYVGFGVAIRAFLTSMRPLLIVYGTHLRGTYQPTNLLAVGIDGNNQIVLIATGVCQGGETTEVWSFFLSKLKDSIGAVQDMTIISDRNPGIVNACATVFPNAFHGYCCRHLLMNCEIRHRNHKAIYWKLCKAYSTSHFDRLYAVLEGFKPGGFPKLYEANFETWSRAYCPTNRYNYLNSDSAECIDSLGKDICNLPITKLVDRLRETLENWFNDRREKYKDATTDELTEWAATKVHHRTLKSAQWIVTPVSKHEFYQVNDRRHVELVNLKSHSCSCRKWQLSGLPCGHVIAVSVSLNITNCCLFAKHWFKKTTVRETYKEWVNPLQEQSSWETPADIQNVLPPMIQKLERGRPTNNNYFQSPAEARDRTPCSFCGKKVHKSMSCKGPKNIQPKRQQNTRRRSLFETGSTSQPST